MYNHWLQIALKNRALSFRLPYNKLHIDISELTQECRNVDIKVDIRIFHFGLKSLNLGVNPKEKK